MELRVELRVREQIGSVVATLHLRENSGEFQFARRVDPTRRVSCDETLEHGAGFEDFRRLFRCVGAHAHAAIGLANHQALLLEQRERASNHGTVRREVAREVEFDEALVRRDLTGDDRSSQKVGNVA